MRNRWRDVRFGLRILARNRTFTAVAILALALGIGPNVAIFSIIWATFLAPLPYPRADQLVVIWNHHKGERNPSSADDFAQWAAQSHSFQELNFESWFGKHLTNLDHSRSDIEGNPVSPGFYSRMLGVPLALGREFLPDEGTPGNDHVVVLSYLVWQHRYHSDPKILGKAILVDDEPYSVVGVLAYQPTDRTSGFFVTPLRVQPGVHSRDVGNVFGRLKPGVTLAQAQAEIAVIDSSLASKRNDRANSWSVSVEQLRNDWLDPKIERNLWLLLGAVGLVLLIACSNVANLLLARASVRQQELALRSALGATGRQIFTQLLTESVTLAVIGGAIGVGLGWAIMKLGMSILPDLTEQVTEAIVQINVPVLCFAAVISVLGGIVFGCAPAWHAAGVNLSETLKQGSRAVAGGRGRTRTQGLLVVTEFALALTLLAGAGMALHSFWNLSRIDLGIQKDHILVGWLASLPGRANIQRLTAPEQIVARQRQWLETVRAVPGVGEAALTTEAPLEGSDNFSFAIRGQPADRDHQPAADLEAVTPGFFQTLEVRLVRGRFLNEEDTTSSPGCVVVSESFVRRYLSGTDPLKTHLILNIPIPGQRQPGPARDFQIVGVSHDILNNSQLTGSSQPEMFVSLFQVPWPSVRLVVRTRIKPGAVSPALGSAIAVSGLVLERIRTLEQIIDKQTTTDRFGMVLFAGFAGVAMLLAALGIYGVMSFTAAQRTHEMGVRIALGAPRNEVVSLIVQSGIRLAVPGMLVGLLGAIVLGRLMRSTLYGVGAIDYASTILVALTLLAIALFACWLPARRSANIDPVTALRDE